MIDRENFSSENPFRKASAKSFALAPVADRFLAVGFDLAIFTPVIALILAPLFRKLELLSLTSPQSTEFSVLLGLAVFYVSLLVILLQTLFLVWKKATPGQMFFKLQVLSLRNPEAPLSLTQSLLRSLVWTLQFFLALLPFLEVFSEAQRRPLHDRAAGTLVVTRKEIGEEAPHPFEADMVRKIMAISFMILALWGMVGVSHLYKMAMTGEFKRAELVANNYLCEEVTASLPEDQTQSDALRLDKAIALFLAGEVEEDCLNSEADFALWSSSDEGSQWAYLAKGLLKKFDKDLAQSYFEKACEAGEPGPACELAKIEKTILVMPDMSVLKAQSFSQQLQETEAGQILLATEDFDEARYAEAEKRFLTFKDRRGYENFSQKGLIKSLWAQDKKEQSEGAFLSSVLRANSETKEEIAAWLCSEQMNEQCSQKSKQSCDILKEPYLKDLRQVEKPLVAMALLKEKDCRGSSDIEIGRFHDLFKDHPDVLKYAQALSQDSSLSATERLDFLRDLSFRKSSVRPRALRVQAIQDLAEKSLRKADIDLIAAQLAKRKNKDLIWTNLSQKIKDKRSDNRMPASSEPAKPQEQK